MESTEGDIPPNSVNAEGDIPRSSISLGSQRLPPLEPQVSPQDLERNLSTRSGKFNITMQDEVPEGDTVEFTEPGAPIEDITNTVDSSDEESEKYIIKRKQMLVEELGNLEISLRNSSWRSLKKRQGDSPSENIDPSSNRRESETRSDEEEEVQAMKKKIKQLSREIEYLETKLQSGGERRRLSGDDEEHSDSLYSGAVQRRLQSDDETYPQSYHDTLSPGGPHFGDSIRGSFDRLSQWEAETPEDYRDDGFAHGRRYVSPRRKAELGDLNRYQERTGRLNDDRGRPYESEDGMVRGESQYQDDRYYSHNQRSNPYRPDIDLSESEWESDRARVPRGYEQAYRDPSRRGRSSFEDLRPTKSELERQDRLQRILVDSPEHEDDQQSENRLSSFRIESPQKKKKATERLMESSDGSMEMMYLPAVKALTKPVKKEATLQQGALPKRSSVDQGIPAEYQHHEMEHHPAGPRPVSTGVPRSDTSHSTASTPHPLPQIPKATSVTSISDNEYRRHASPTSSTATSQTRINSIPDVRTQPPKRHSVAVDNSFPQLTEHQPTSMPSKPEKSQTYTVSEILGEDRPSRRTHKPKDILKDFAQAAKHDTSTVVAKADTPRDRKWTRIIRIVNFFRALATTSYGMYVIVSTWDNPQYTSVGAMPFLKTSLVFLAFDLLFTLIKAFPHMLWFCWDVKTWDPFSKSFSIWTLIADHELLLDMSPILVNVILKVYAFRLGEIITTGTNPDGRSPTFLDGTPLQPLALSHKSMNFALLIVFCATLMLTVTLHTLRLVKALYRRGAFALGVLVVVKILMVVYDLGVNAWLLYETLVFQQNRIFQLDPPVQLVLSVFAVAPAIVLTTNVIVNLPIHYTYLRMQLRGRRLSTGVRGEDISSGRIFRSALRKTFNPLIVGIFGTYAIYSLIALALLLKSVRNFDWRTTPAIPSTLGTQDKESALFSMVFVNVVGNYGIGVVCAVLYWVVGILGILGLARIWNECRR